MHSHDYYATHQVSIKLYSSNHTLSKLFLPEHDNPNHLNYLQKMNRERNKSYVAMRKILKYHPKIDMEPFFGWDAEDEWTLKGLPYVLAWFEKAREADHYFAVEKRKLLAIYEFAKATPLKFAASSSIKAGDRKRKSVGK